MRFVSLISTILNLHRLTVSQALTIPVGNIIPITQPHLNLSSISGRLRIPSSGQAESNLALSNTSISTEQPWPAAPFDFESQSWPGWSIHVQSYEAQRLTFLQMDALLTTCVDEIPVLIAKDPSQPAPARTIIQRPRQQSPLDLSRQDVEIAFFNSDEEPGSAFGPRDMIYTLQVVIEILVSQDARELSRKVAHYVEFVPVCNGRRFKRVRIRRRTDVRPPRPPPTIA